MDTKETTFQLVNLPKFLDERGNLSFIEAQRQVPFDIARSYWIYDVPGGETRGGHSYYQNEELIVALSGSFDVVIDDGKQSHKISLNRSYYGLYIPKGFWRHMENFSTNALALVLASTAFDASDYERDHERYINSKA
jgi:dTDP-4-dehydrorhamnose 3,5-epimerase-like enzyme